MSCAVAGVAGARVWAAGVLLVASSALAGDTAWVRRYSGQSSGVHNRAADIAIDAEGNVYVCGSGEKTYPGNTDMLIVKYSPDGELLWADAIGGDLPAFEDMAQALAIDSLGNVYVAGMTSNADSCMFDMTIAKYDRNGNRLWNGCRKTRWRYDDFCLDIALGRHGDVYVCGVDGRDSLGVGNDAFCVMRLDPANGSTVWSRSYLLSIHPHSRPRRFRHPNLYDEWQDWDNCATALAVAPDGGIVATGFGQDDTGDSEMWSMKFDTAGNRLWEKLCHAAAGIFDDVAFDLAVSRNGDSYLAGLCERPASGEDFAVVKLDNDGLLVAGWLMDAPFSDCATAIALDDSIPENVYVTGTCEHPDLSWQIVTQKLSANLEPRWGSFGAQFGTADTDESGYGIAVNSGRVYVTGVDTTCLALLCYSSRNVVGGETLWTRILEHSRGLEEMGVCLGVADSDHIYVAGESFDGQLDGTALLTARFCTASALAEPAVGTGTQPAILPNPTPRHCLLRGLAPSPGTRTISLYDVAGRLARDFRASGQEATVALDLSGLCSGVYLLRAGTGSVPVTRQLVIP